MMFKNSSSRALRSSMKSSSNRPALYQYPEHCRACTCLPTPHISSTTTTTTTSNHSHCCFRGNLLLSLPCNKLAPWTNPSQRTMQRCLQADPAAPPPASSIAYSGSYCPSASVATQSRCISSYTSFSNKQRIHRHLAAPSAVSTFHGIHHRPAALSSPSCICVFHYTRTLLSNSPCHIEGTLSVRRISVHRAL